uniref:Uncharacterized protein n=1 Tax=Chelonoidis abingdonii TaxID=106734 RepID=A0A8C0H0E3_CHEAB
MGVRGGGCCRRMEGVRQRLPRGWGVRGTGCSGQMCGVRRRLLWGDGSARWRLLALLHSCQRCSSPDSVLLPSICSAGQGSCHWGSLALGSFGFSLGFS